MAIEIVDFPIKNGDFPLLCDSSPEGIIYPIDELNTAELVTDYHILP